MQAKSAKFIGTSSSTLLHNHRMRNLHLCTLAVVMANCSYGIYI